MSQQQIGVFVRAALPGALRIAEVDLHIHSYRKVLVFRHLQSAVPRQRAFQRSGEFANMLTRDVAGAFFPRRFKELRTIDQEITSYCFAVPGWRSRSH